MHIGPARKTFEPEPARGGIAQLRKTARAITAAPPAAGAIFDKGMEKIPAALQSQGDRTRSAPLVERVRIEKAHQNVKAARGARQLAGGAQRVIKTSAGNLAGIKSWLGGGGELAAHLSLPASSV